MTRRAGFRTSTVGVVLALALFVVTRAVADTVHENVTINGNAVWTAAGNDHIVIGSVTIGASGSLTIDPGVTVKFEDAVGMSVYGTLTAVGTAGQGILLTRRDATDQWTGLSFGGASAVGTLAYCTIERATKYTSSGAIVTSGIWPTVEHCTIRNNNYGIYASGVTSPSLTVNNLIQDNANNGLYFNNCPGAQVTNQTVTGHATATGAISFVNTNGFRIGTGNVLTGNTWAVTMDFASYPDASCAGNIPLAGNTNNDGLHVNGGSTSAAEVWHPVGANYVVTSGPTIQGVGSLTIDPGVTVKFEDAVGMSVYGTLTAVGTAGQGILLTRRDATDQWTGLSFSGASAVGTLAYCTVERATKYTSSGAIVTSGIWPTVEHCTIRNNNYGIYASGVTSPSLTVNNLIQDNANNGLYFNNCPAAQVTNQTVTGHATATGAISFVNTNGFRIGTGNVLTGNTWAVTMDFASYPDASCAGNIPLAGNTNNDGLQVHGGSTSAAEVWHPVGANYVVTSGPTIQGVGSLTIDPGVTVKFEDAVGLSVYGTLTAVGTAGQGILLTRRDATDQWTGLSFSGASAVGTLAYCTVERATRYTSSGAIVTSGVWPTVEHCTIRNNNYGIYASGVTSPSLTVNNLIQDNANNGLYFNNCPGAQVTNQTVTGHATATGAISFVNTNGFRIGTGNVLMGNTWAVTMDFASYPDASCAGNIPLAGNTNNDGLHVNGGSTSAAEVWHPVGANYVVTSGPTIQGGGSLTIDPGVTVKFEDAVGMSVYGTLTAVGTAGQGILLTRRDATDQWTGLSFSGASAVGTLAYCTIERATKYTSSAAIAASSVASLAVTNCTLSNNVYGVNASTSSLQFLNTRIIDNTQYGIYLNGACSPTFGNSLAEWNDIFGNGSGQPDRDLRNGSEDIAARYVYWGTIIEAEIQSRIRHEPDDAALGLVHFGPWTNGAHDTQYGGVIAVEEDVLPEAYALGQNSPNPFNPSTVIPYALPASSQVRLEIFDIAGNRIATLIDEFQTAGYKSHRWDARGLPSGVYFYRIAAGTFSQTGRMLLLK